ncbi:MAG: flagellar biosynthetic protein FliR [Bdellovibrionales bacterium]|nr:flagellar biosynthetic protein FliR [Bdellovibrionales bacterium]
MEIFTPQATLLFARSIGFVLLLPGGFRIFPFTARLIVALVLTFGFLGSSGAFVDRAASPLVWTFLLIGEALIGAAISLPLSLAVDAMGMFGDLLEKGRGQQLGMAYGADTGGQTAILAQFFQYATIASLYLSGSLLSVTATFGESLQILPHSGGATQSLAPWGELLFSVFGNVVSEVFFWFLPIAMLFVTVDICLGVVSKLVPGMPLFGEMFTCKSALLFWILLSIFFPSYDQITDRFLSLGSSPFNALRIEATHSMTITQGG